MNPGLKIRFDKLQDQKAVLVDKVQNLDNQQINSKANGDGWTLGQVYYHLFLVEEGTFRYMADKVKEIAAIDKAGFKSQWRSLLLKVFLAMPWKYKAPSRVSDSIPDEVDIKRVIEDWTQVRDKFHLLLSAQDDQYLSKKIFKHPRIGYINFYQTLEFIKAHHQHHFRQINNLLSNI
jgi:hypothetical protein